MSTSQLISHTPRRPYVIAPSVKQKEKLLKSIDRYCSLYYITMGSAYNIAQTAMIDALGAIKEDKKLYRQKTKQSINKALAAYIYDRAGEYALQLNPEYRPENFGE